ncbi:hypothetical protein Btru_062199 [Bulinus truncatus]|nr:hypothetical protein Btru_062199 [Bulinus truncatus]
MTGVGVSDQYGCKEKVSLTESTSGCVLKFTSCRWVLAYMLFFLRICQISLRQSIGMCLVCMVDRSNNNESAANVTFITANQTEGVPPSEDLRLSSFLLMTNQSDYIKETVGVSDQYGCKEKVSLTESTSGCVLKFTSCRWVLAYMLFFLRICQISLRQSIGMCLVCMVDRSNDNGSAANVTFITANQTEGVPPSEDLRLSSFLLMTNQSDYIKETEYSREFVWDSTFQGLVLSSYYYGYLLTPLLASYIERFVGAKLLIAVSIGAGALIGFVTPELTRVNKYLLVVLRVLAGTTNGMVDPPIQILWSVWAPKSEIAYLSSVEYAGVSIGGIMTFLVSGLLCQIPVNNGWPFVFYFYGCVNIVWLLLWLMLVYNRPSEHPRISKSELMYISSQTYCCSPAKQKSHPPWLKLLSSPCVWALIIATSSFTWVYTWVVCYLPMYMQDVLKYSLTQNAVLSPLPFVGTFICGLACGYLADRLLRTRLPVTANRKMFQMIGSVGCAAATVAIGFLEYDSRELAVTLMVLLVTIQNISTAAIRVNALDIAPRYSGFILAICSTISVAASLSGPLVTSSVIYQQVNQKQWQTMFYVVASISLIGGSVFLVLGTAQMQPWDQDMSDLTIVQECPPDSKVPQDSAHTETENRPDETTENTSFIEQKDTIQMTIKVTSSRAEGPYDLEVITTWGSDLSLSRC